MEIITLMYIISFILIIFASISDLKTREVPDWLSFSLLILGVVAYLIYSISKRDIRILINPGLGFISCFILGLVMYYSRQWGGGDAKLIMSLGIIFSTYPHELTSVFNPYLGNIPFFVILLMNILITGAIYGILWTIYLAIKNKKVFLEEFKKEFSKNKLYRLLVSIFCLIILGSALFVESTLKILFFILGVLLFMMFYLSLTIKSVENSCMFKKIKVENLTEGDWVYNQVKVNDKIIYNPRNTGILKSDIELLMKNKNNIDPVLVKEGIPFIPSFLIACVISLIYGNILMMFFI